MLHKKPPKAVRISKVFSEILRADFIDLYLSTQKAKKVIKFISKE